MKILLILPASEKVRVTRERPEVPRRAMLRFSVLPLTIVAALTPREHEVSVVDENVEALDLETDCDVVGITFMTALAPRAYQIAAHFRSRGKVVVGGGYHPTLCPGDAAAHLDAVVIGDAEGAWERLLADIEAGALRKYYRAAEDSGALKTPCARRELLTQTAEHYATVNAVQAGRGCRHSCRYCSVTVFHEQKYRRREIAEVVREIASMRGDFIFVDDNIIADREYAAALFCALAPLRKRWVSQCSVLIADDAELLKLAHDAGCRGLFLGVETDSEANLAQMNKRFNRASTYGERLERIHRAGIGVIAGMIVGMDEDDVSVFERTLRFLEQTRVDALQLNILTPLPGTPLHAEMKSAGRVVDGDWRHYDYRHVVFQPARMSAEQLQAGADWLYGEFYRLDRILWRFARGVIGVGIEAAWLGLKLGLTYRYDNRREGIRGRNPAHGRTTAVKSHWWKEAVSMPAA